MSAATDNARAENDWFEKQLERVRKGRVEREQREVAAQRKAEEQAKEPELRRHGVIADWLAPRIAPETKTAAASKASRLTAIERWAQTGGSEE